jgi:phage baseplate assembly protein gpV
MDRHLNRMRAEAMRAMRVAAVPRQAIVTSYDPTHHMAKVIIMPEGGVPSDQDGVVETSDDPSSPSSTINLNGQPLYANAESGWLPILVQWSGPGWGIYSPPTPGDQVTVLHLEEHSGSGLIIGRCYDINHLPLAVNSGEWWLVHATGSFIKLTNDGKLSLNGDTEIVATGPTIDITAGTVCTVSGPTINVSGGDVVNVNAPTINLAGGGPDVARVGDQVVVGGSTGTITTGSSKVNSG